MIHVNGVEIDYKTIDGFAIIDREWDANDKIELYLPMPVEEVYANKNVKENIGRFAIQRGPLVYCVEGIDQADIHIKNMVATHSTGFVTQFESDLLNGIQSIMFDAHTALKNPDGSIHFDRSKKEIKSIPYYVWANRGPGEMLVWIPYSKSGSNPKL